MRQRLLASNRWTLFSAALCLAAASFLEMWRSEEVSCLHRATD